MQGKQQRSTATMPDYKVLAGKVSRRQSETNSRNPAASASQPEASDDPAFGDASNTSHSTGGVFKNAAVHILQSERRLMSTGEITKIALERKLVKATGKTPENTMASALYTDVRKRGSNSPFFKPKEGLFGLKAWLAEVWLQEWLAKEGIAVDELVPDAADSPPTKRPRTGRQHRSENEHRATVPQRSATSTGYTEMDTDSDEKTSNLNLLLEAANEIEREDDRHEASQLAKARKKHSPSPSPTVSNTRALKLHGKAKPSPRPTEDSEAGPSHPSPLPYATGPTHPFMMKGLPPMPPLAAPPGLPFMNYAFLNPLMAQQLAAAAAAGQLPIDPSRLSMLSLGLPFHGSLPLDAMPPIPPLTPSISPAATPVAVPAPAAPSSPVHLELTGRSIASILKASRAATDPAAAKDGDKAGAKKEPINILNLPLPSFDFEDLGSTEDGPEPEASLHQPADDADTDLRPAASSPPAGEDAADSEAIEHGAAAGSDVAAAAAAASEPQVEAGDSDEVLGAAADAMEVDGGVAAARRGADPAGVLAMEDDEVGDGDDGQAGAARPSMEAAAAKLALRELKRVSEASGGSAASKLQEHEKINLYRQHIQFLERSLGNMHPQVGKAYVFLGRALQHEGSRWSLTMAQRALLRAWQILASVKTRVDQDQPASLNDFSYLMGHLQETQSLQAVQLQQLHMAGAQAVASQAKLPSMMMFQPPGPLAQQPMNSVGRPM